MLVKKPKGKGVEMFPNLFRPGVIGNVEIKNRIIKAPQTTGMGGRDGSVTPRLLRFYKELALGGAGMIIVEYTFIDHIASKSAHCQTGIADNEFIAGLALLAETIKDNGARACLQIEHCGRQKFLGTPPIKAPSRVPWEELYAMTGVVPEELTIEEIQQIVKAFGDAALRTKQAGFDMVEVHGAHGYLITEFLSPRTNKRTDWYGGSLENRMRFLIEVIRDIKRKVGPDFPVGVRLSGSEYEPDGVKIEETIEVAKALEKEGVSYIHVSGGNHHTMMHQVVPMYLPLAHNIWAAEAVKKEVKIPVIGSGSIQTPQLAEEILAAGKCDFVALGRPLLADPYWPKKAEEGRPEDIVPCIRCNDGCLERTLMRWQAIKCTVNPLLGREDDFKIVPTEKPKNVIIVGGGPAGMQAAIIAKLRGHNVTLYEKRKLGGLLNEASVPEFKADLRRLVNYFITQIQKLGIKVIYEEATVEKIKNSKCDALIVAVGGKPIIPDIPGKDEPIVVSALDVLSGVKDVGEKVAVIGGGIVGTETAWYLAQRGKKVIAIEITEDYAIDIWPGVKSYILDELKKLGVEIHTGQRLESISKDGIITTVDKHGVKRRFKVDNVVLALGFTRDDELINKYKEACDEVYVIGDATEPRKIFDAIHEGHRAAIWL
jgi:2,4-dienoyl-CoA reductase-like NADH-dependent reductase (Old Yellow Enzyme family)/thioredoxin reductase